MRIAVLLTSYNRKAKTLACLEHIRSLAVPSGCRVYIFLLDDGSPDGTAVAVRQDYPEVRVLSGTGSLYWAGGMRRIWVTALACDYDRYLLVGDDTLLHPQALHTLLCCPSAGIVIGTTVDSQGSLSHGGRRLTGRLQRGLLRRWQSRMVHSQENFLTCHLGNANIMLVPRQVVKKIGILSAAYTHGLAGYDYCLRARKAGCPVWVAPGILGSSTDELNSSGNLTYHEYLHFIRTHFPFSLPKVFFTHLKNSLGHYAMRHWVT